MKTLLYIFQSLKNIKNCGDVGYTKDRDILANIMGMGNGTGVRIFAEGTLIVALSKIYPEIGNLNSVTIFKELISHPSSAEITQTLLRHDGISITPEEYEALVIRICQLLTGNDKVKVVNGRIHFTEPSEILDWINRTNSTFENLARVLRPMI